MEQTSLKRSLSLPLITLYGLGTILGAGIYVLTGEVAGLAGEATPWAFLIASLLAAFSAFSYAELSARYPLSAGEAVYVFHGFHRVWLSRLVGLLLVSISVVSTATLLKGFVGYLDVFLILPDALVIGLLAILLGGIAIWGITESALVAALTTLVEMGGLLLIIWVSGDSLLFVPTPGSESIPAPAPEVSPFSLGGVLAGAFVAFYAYIGFEDIVNVAEEVKAPSRNLPLAVFLALGISTLLYMTVASLAVSVVPPQELAGSGAPLALVYERATGEAPVFITLIGMAAVLNGALIQFIMASRVLYGMARQGWLPPGLGRVNHRTRTPVPATLLISVFILALALSLPLVDLANITSLITLSMFTLVNAALWQLKRLGPAPSGVPDFPAILPLAGLLACLGFIGIQLFQWIS